MRKNLDGTNEEYWTKKLIRNKERDYENQEKLKQMGWKVIIVWECELKKERLDSSLRMLCNRIKDITVHSPEVDN